jgi:hypothetical protein
MKNALGAIPGVFVKSAQVIERIGDALRSGAKERKRVKEERGRKDGLAVLASPLQGGGWRKFARYGRQT